MAIAGMGVAMKAVIISGMVCMGLGQGIQPIPGAGLAALFAKPLSNRQRASVSN